MSRDGVGRILDGAGAALLVLFALSVTLPFRAAALERTALPSLGWDAALHATEGLDLYDDVRLFRPFDALALLASRHWWGPSWALVSAPFQAVFGPSLAAASLPSLVAFILAPAVAFLLARRISPSGFAAQTLAWIVAAGLFLRSPMLLEMSAWPMLESFGGLGALLAFFFFAKRGDRTSRRAAFLAGAVLFLLKYHFGLFVLTTFLAVVLLEEEVASRRRLAASARANLFRGAGVSILGLALAGAALRVGLERRGGDALASRVPSVSNVLWGSLVLLLVLGVARRRTLADAWSGASGVFRDFISFGILPCGIWCLDPANVRALYRQILPDTERPVWNPVAKLDAFWGFLRDDYTLSKEALVLVALGLVLAAVLRGSTTRRALAAFAVWPVILMSLSTYPVEARFLACLVPGLFAAAASGLVEGMSRAARAARGVEAPWRARAWRAAALLAVVFVFAAVREERWGEAVGARAPYRFSYGERETAAVKAAVVSASGSATGPVLLRLPAEPPVWPTVRFAIRLDRRDLAPRDVDVAALPAP